MRIISQHLKNASETLKKQADQCGIAKHGNNSGQARETLVEYFLSRHMPNVVSYISGEIFDCNDMRSGQLDIILHPIGSPRLNLFGSINLVMADSVLAVIEVKSSLTTASIDQDSHLKSALNACEKIKSMNFGNDFRSDGILLKTIPYIIFAFNGPSERTLRDKLDEFKNAKSIDMGKMPDLITVLNENYYLVNNNGWLIQKVPGNVDWSSNSDENAVLLGIYAYLSKILELYLIKPCLTGFSKYLQ